MTGLKINFIITYLVEKFHLRTKVFLALLPAPTMRYLLILSIS